MGGMFDDLFDVIGDVVGTVCGIAVAPIAITLGVSQKLVIRAIESGCSTVEEIKEFIDDLEL